MKFLEKDLEQIIWESDRNDLCEKGLVTERKMLRQVKIGKYGVADLVGMDRPYYAKSIGGINKGTITVYELKQDQIGISAFLQALGYIKGIKSYLDKRGMIFLFDFRIVLIGRRIDDKSTYSFIGDFASNPCDFRPLRNKQGTFNSSILIVENYTYYFHLNGFNFSMGRDLKLQNEGF